MQGEQQVLGIFDQLMPLEQVKQRWTAADMAGWLRMPEWQHHMVDAILRNPAWGVPFLEWIVTEGGYRVDCETVRYHFLCFLSLLHVVLHGSGSLEVARFCIVQCKRHFDKAHWERLLRQMVHPTYMTCTAKLQWVIDGGNVTRPLQREHRVNQCIARRRSCQRAVYAMLSLSRRVPRIRQCAPRDVMKQIGRLLWTTRWDETWDLEAKK